MALFINMQFFKSDSDIVPFSWYLVAVSYCFCLLTEDLIYKNLLLQKIDNSYGNNDGMTEQTEMNERQSVFFFNLL